MFVDALVVFRSFSLLGNLCTREAYPYGCSSEESESAVIEKAPVQIETATGTTQPAARNIDLFERFLVLPVPIVLLSMWLAGAALIGLCVLTLYHVCRVLV